MHTKYDPWKMIRFDVRMGHESCTRGREAVAQNHGLLLARISRQRCLPFTVAISILVKLIIADLNYTKDSGYRICGGVYVLVSTPEPR